MIRDLSELSEHLTRAQDVLVRYQLTVAAHEPRQLVPVYLEQFTHENWRPDIEPAGDEAE